MDVPWARDCHEHLHRCQHRNGSTKNNQKYPQYHCKPPVTNTTERALRSKKFNPDREFQSWFEILDPDRHFSSAIKNFNPGVSISGAPLVYRKGLDRKVQSQETFSRLQGLLPRRPLPPSPIDLGEVQEFRQCTRVSGSQTKETKTARKRRTGNLPK